MEYYHVSGKDFGDIRLFALSTCGWCKRTKAFLDEHNVAYHYCDIDRLSGDDLDEARAEQKKFNPTGSFPTIVVDGQKVIVGYDLNSLNGLVGEE